MWFALLCLRFLSFFISMLFSVVFGSRGKLSIFISVAILLSAVGDSWEETTAGFVDSDDDELNNGMK